MRMQPMSLKVGQIATAAGNALDEHPNYFGKKDPSYELQRCKASVEKRYDRLCGPFWMALLECVFCLVCMKISPY